MTAGRLGEFVACLSLSLLLSTQTSFATDGESPTSDDQVPRVIVPPEPERQPRAENSDAAAGPKQSDDSRRAEQAPRPGDRRNTRRFIGDNPPARFRVSEFGHGGRTSYHSPYDEPLTAVVLPHGTCYGVDPWGIQWALEEAYWQGRVDEKYYSRRVEGEEAMKVRGERVLARHDESLKASLVRLKAGEYERAVIGLTLSAKLDQGDSACRMHLAQARLALGHYEEAALALRRALQLQPKLIYADLKLAQYYPSDGDLERFSEALNSELARKDASAEVRFLQGFLMFQRGDFAAAHRALKLADYLAPNDDLTRDLLEITRPARRASR